MKNSSNECNIIFWNFPEEGNLARQARCTLIFENFSRVVSFLFNIYQGIFQHLRLDGSVLGDLFNNFGAYWKFPYHLPRFGILGRMESAPGQEQLYRDS